MKGPWTQFTKIELSEMPEENRPVGVTRAFTNNRVCVSVYEGQPMSDGSTSTRVMIQRWDNMPIEQWSVLQRIKNECFGKETVAIQYFPKESELVNDKNIYWIWIMDQLPTPAVFKHPQVGNPSSSEQG